MKKQVLSALAFCSALGIAQAQTDVTRSISSIRLLRL